MLYTCTPINRLQVFKILLGFSLAIAPHPPIYVRLVCDFKASSQDMASTMTCQCMGKG